MAGNVLLVEGTDDEHVVYHLCEHHGIPKNFEVKRREGFERVLKGFPSYLKAQGDDDAWTVGVLIDANAGLQTRWNSLRQHLEEAGYPPPPANPPKGGFISNPPSAGRSLPCRAGVWLMPDNRSRGAIEDFLCSMAGERTHPLHEHARQSIAAIPAGYRLFSQKDQAKALLHTLLAWQQEPGKPFGAAIKAGYLDPGAPQAVAFVGWLRRLFEGNGGQKNSPAH